MLVTRLDMVFVVPKIHPIAVELCGVLSCLIGIVKLFRDDKQVKPLGNYSINANSDYQHPKVGPIDTFINNAPMALNEIEE